MKRAVAIIAAVAALMLPACSSDSNRTSQAEAPSTGAWSPVAGLPFEEPSQLFRNDAGVLEVTLTASTQTIKVSGSDLGARPFTASVKTAYGADQPLPTTLNGPTLHVYPGDTIKVTFVNNLGVDGQGNGIPTNIHYHGLHVDPKGIGDNIFRTFDNGQTYQSEVTLPNPHRLGTYWYHVHYHGISDGQVMGGLAGLLIVEDLVQLLGEDFRDVPQRQLAFQGVQHCRYPGGYPPPPPTECGDSIFDEEDINPNRPSTRLVNGLYQPTFSIQEGQYELWRLANISADVFYLLKLEGHAFFVAAESGIAVSRGLPTPREELLLPPGQRFDVLVLGGTPGQYRLQSLPYAQHAGGGDNLIPEPLPTEAETLATVTVTAAAPSIAAAPALPEGLVPEEDLSDPAVLGALSDLPVTPRRFTFSYRGPDCSGPQGVFIACINGQRFDPNIMPIVAPVVGTVEEWTLVNTTNDDHPFHIHVNDFQVLSVNGQPYDATGLQDIVNIPKRYRNADGQIVDGQVVIRIEFTDFTGWFVFHCHILNHEDAGMMATVQVRASESEAVTPPPPHPDGSVAGSMPGHGG